MLASTYNLRAVAVHYVLDEGPRTIPAILTGETRLIAVVLAFPDGWTFSSQDQVVDALLRYASGHRVYEDALVSLAVEQKYLLPSPGSFDDLSTMKTLVDGVPWHKPEPVMPDIDPARFLWENREREAREQAHRTIAEWPRLQAALAEMHSDYLYREIELPVLGMILGTSCVGIRLDLEWLGQAATHWTGRLEKARANVAQVAGEPLNPDVDEDVRAFLLNQLPRKATYRRRTIRNLVIPWGLERLDEPYHILEALKVYFQTKFLLNQSRALAGYCDQRSGCLCPDLRPLGTPTGRITCVRPDLQSLPGPLRRAVVAREGHCLLYASYEQFALHVFAQLAGVPSLPWASSDEHGLRWVAESLSGAKPEAVGRLGWETYGNDPGFPVRDNPTVRDLVNQTGSCGQVQRFFDLYPQVKAWITTIEENAQRTETAQTILGRYQRVTQLNAVRTLVQASSSDLFKEALVRIFLGLPSDCRIVLPLHDSVLLEVPEGRVIEIAAWLQGVMEVRPPGFQVPLPIRMRIGHNWAQCMKAEPLIEHLMPQFRAGCSSCRQPDPLLSVLDRLRQP